jgi:hypothetical protein
MFFNFFAGSLRNALGKEILCRELADWLSFFDESFLCGSLLFAESLALGKDFYSRQASESGSEWFLGKGKFLGWYLGGFPKLSGTYGSSSFIMVHRSKPQTPNLETLNRTLTSSKFVRVGKEGEWNRGDENGCEEKFM